MCFFAPLPCSIYWCRCSPPFLNYIFYSSSTFFVYSLRFSENCSETIQFRIQCACVCAVSSSMFIQFSSWISILQDEKNEICNMRKIKQTNKRAVMALLFVCSLSFHNLAAARYAVHWLKWEPSIFIQRFIEYHNFVVSYLGFCSVAND